MKSRIFILSTILIISLNWDNLFSVFSNNENWKILIFLFLLLLFVLIFSSKDWREEFLNWCILIGSLMILTTDNLFLLYLGLELQTFPIFILISKNKLWLKSSEAGLKYFILGALSSGLFLLGCSILFYSSGSINISSNINSNFINNWIFLGVWGIILLPLFFKVGLVPLHFWLPDIYEGSDWQTIKVLSSIPKISVIYIIFQLKYISYIIFLVGGFSIILGVLGALNQTKLKRLIAYSGITHAGFIIALLFSINSQFIYIPSIYIIIYMLTLIFIITILEGINLSKNSYIVEIQNKEITLLESAFLIILILSLAGIPPLSGFMTKWLLFVSLLNSNYIFFSLVCLIFSFIAAFYYLRLIKISSFNSNFYFNSWERILINNNKLNLVYWYVLPLVVYLSLFLIFKPNFFFLLSNFLII